MALCLVPGAASAQRLIPGQRQLSFGGFGWYHFPMGDCANPTVYGGEVQLSFIGYGGNMFTRVSGMHSLQSDYRIADNADAGWSAGSCNLRDIDLFGSLGYMLDLAHSRSRGVNFWGGVSVDVGARIRRLAPKSATPVYGYPPASFLLGGSPELNLEFFLGRSCSLDFFVRAHMHWCAKPSVYSENSPEVWFYPQAGVKLGFNFFADR